tara:strand:- start:416 stop:685 length:270 start_codon:yes stop_codon:yes gene_type:complete
MEKQNKHITVLYTLAVMLTAWCTWNTANTGGVLSSVNEYRTEVHSFQRQVASLIDIANSQEQRDTDVMVKEVIEEIKATTEDEESDSVE